MNPDEYWAEKVGKSSLKQICPECGKQSLKHTKDGFLCTECGFEHKILTVEK